MHSRLFLHLIWLLPWVLGATGTGVSAATAEITVSVTLSRDTIGLDENATLQVEVSGSAKSLPEPKMPTLPAFEIYSQGHSSNISIVNGVVSSSVVYRFLVLPTKAGTFPIEGIAVVHANKRYAGNRVELTVLSRGSTATDQLEETAADAQGSTKDYFLQAVVDKKNPYVNEQVTLTLKFYTALQYYGSPELSEPTLTGFWTEVIGNKPPYYQTVNGRRYRVMERKYALFPTQTGELTIGQATIRATFAASRRRRDPFDVFGDFFNRGVEKTVSSRPVSISVKSLPSEGRPDDFTGTIGQFDISVQADKREVEVNQPVTVTFRIRGTGNVKSVAEPSFPQLRDFRVYRASSSEDMSVVKDKVGGTKTYEEVFIPNRPGDLEIPAISFSYFDPERERYQAASTRPIRVTVTRPEGYAGLPNASYPSSRMLIGSEAADIRFIKQRPGGFVKGGQVLLVTPLYLAVNGFPVVLLAVMVAVRKRREKLAADVGYARSRSAGRMARKRLAAARSLARPETIQQFYGEIHQALVSYIADKLNVSPNGLTSDRVRELLEERRAEKSLIDDFVALLQACDFARFSSASSGAVEIAEALKNAEKTMIRMAGVKFE